MIPAIATHATTSLVPSLINVCSQLAPPLSVAVCAAPLPTIRSIQRNEDVGSLPLLPYSCMAANCCLWTTYGFMKREASIWAPNLVGTILALYYTFSFIQFAPKKSPTLPGSVRQHVGSVAGVFLAVTAAVLTSVNPASIGQAAVLFCIALFASPLASIKTVISTKSARSIPLPFTIAATANCLTWTVTGVLKLKDWNVIVPNALGLAFGLAQVMLKLMYGNRDPEQQPGYVLATP